MLMYVLVATALYLVIGLVIGSRRIARGIYGSAGPVDTLISWALLWPLILLYESSDRR